MVHQVAKYTGSVEREAAATDLVKVVQEVAAELRPQQAVRQLASLDSSLDRELGFDSLARVELLTRIESHFRVTLPDQVLIDAETPRDLLHALLSAATPAGVPESAEVSHDILDEVQTNPRQAKTLIEVLDWHAQFHPERPHVRLYSDADDGEVISYGQLADGARAVAAGLQARGLQTGERVTIMLPTGSDYFFSFFGVLLAGGVPVPIYPPVRPAQIEEHMRRHQGILNNCLATTLITVAQAKPIARLLKSQVASLRTVTTVAALANTATTYTKPNVGADDIALLQYTSGSTGNPKGVVLTHANLLTNIRAMGETNHVDATDVFVSWLPLYHDMGLIGAWLGTLYYSVLLVLMSPLAFLTRPQRWLWALHRYRGTISAGPNFGYEFCLRRLQDAELEGLDLSSWRLAFNGAEFISPTTIQQFCERFQPYGFRPEAMTPVYGLAECSLGLAFPSLERGVVVDRIRRDVFTQSGQAEKAGDTESDTRSFIGCGHPLPGHEFRVVDATGRELPERMEGRLQFRGPCATQGYFRNPEATRDLFHDDWLDSGDLAYIANGELFLTGRAKDIIIRAGRNLYPHELEEAVGNLELIRTGNVAVFGSPDPAAGTERLVVVAETREKDPAALESTYAEINTLAADLIGAPPDDIILARPGTVLKTSSGKIRRAACRNLYESGQINKPQRAVWWQVTRLACAALIPQLRRAGRVLSAMLFATYAWMIFSILAPVGWMAGTLLPRFSWRWGGTTFIARVLFRATGTTVTVNGLEHLPQSGQPCILVANHASYLDGPLLFSALPLTMTFVAKAELNHQLFAGPFLRGIGAEFVERFDKQKGIQDARRVASAAGSGRPLVFFPEGTFMRMPGLLPFHLGAFAAAVEAGVPVVPIAIRGSRSILRAGTGFPRHGTIRITIGAPITSATEATVSVDPWKIILKLRDNAREHILNYSGEPDLAGSVHRHR